MSAYAAHEFETAPESAGCDYCGQGKDDILHDKRPTLAEEAERLLSYWELHGDDEAVVSKWAMQDMLGILRYIVEEAA